MSTKAGSNNKRVIIQFVWKSILFMEKFSDVFLSANNVFEIQEGAKCTRETNNV